MRVLSRNICPTSSSKGESARFAGYFADRPAIEDDASVGREPRRSTIALSATGEASMLHGKRIDHGSALSIRRGVIAIQSSSICDSRLDATRSAWSELPGRDHAHCSREADSANGGVQADRESSRRASAPLAPAAAANVSLGPISLEGVQVTSISLDPKPRQIDPVG